MAVFYIVDSDGINRRQFWIKKMALMDQYIEIFAQNLALIGEKAYHNVQKSNKFLK